MLESSGAASGNPPEAERVVNPVLGGSEPTGSQTAAAPDPNGHWDEGPPAPRMLKPPSEDGLGHPLKLSEDTRRSSAAPEEMRSPACSGAGSLSARPDSLGGRDLSEISSPDDRRRSVSFSNCVRADSSAEGIEMRETRSYTGDGLDEKQLLEEVVRRATMNEDEDDEDMEIGSDDDSDDDDGSIGSLSSTATVNQSVHITIFKTCKSAFQWRGKVVGKWILPTIFVALCLITFVRFRYSGHGSL